jgi:hypothetical protein
MIEILLFKVNFCQLRHPCCKFDCKTSVRSFENSHANADIDKCLEVLRIVLFLCHSAKIS